MTATGRPDSTRESIRPDLPGADLVSRGMDDLRRGELTVEALLVVVGAPRLRSVGLEIPAIPALSESAELALYAAVGASEAGDVHSRYNALIRRLVSFERAMDALYPVP